MWLQGSHSHGNRRKRKIGSDRDINSLNHQVFHIYQGNIESTFYDDEDENQFPFENWKIEESLTYFSILTPSSAILATKALPPARSIASTTCVSLSGLANAIMHPPPPAPVSLAPKASAPLAA